MIKVKRFVGFGYDDLSAEDESISKATNELNEFIESEGIRREDILELRSNVSSSRCEITMSWWCNKEVK